MHHDSAYTTIRFQTEVGAFCNLCASILCLVCAYSTNPVKTAVMFDLLANGLLSLIILLCDFYMFYDRLCAVVKVSCWKRTLIHSYIWILLVLPWFPAYSFIPIFCNTNDPLFTRIFYVSAYTVSAAIVVYNFIITFEFTKILLSIYLPGIARSAKIAAATGCPSNTASIPLATIKSVAVRSIGHCLTSSSGVFCYVGLPVYGAVVQTLIVVAGMVLYRVVICLCCNVLYCTVPYCVVLYFIALWLSWIVLGRTVYFSVQSVILQLQYVAIAPTRHHCASEQCSALIVVSLESLSRRFVFNLIACLCHNRNAFLVQYKERREQLACRLLLF